MGANDNVSGLIFLGKAIFALPGMACREIEKNVFSLDGKMFVED